MRRLVERVGVPRLLVGLFLLILFALAGLQRLPVKMLISSALVRIGMNGVLVLAMLPSIRAGLGLNFGLPLGVISGIVGMLVSLELRLSGLAGFFFALLVGVLLSLPAGYVYGLLLNRVKGEEMMVGTYMGFSLVAGMCMFWLLAPFKNPEMIWVVGGKGLRVTIPISHRFGGVLDNLGKFNIGGVEVPAGLLLFFAFLCVLVYLFSFTRTGMAMKAAGMNPAFARASGVNVEKMRILGATLSTVLGAVGIAVYAQSLGFVQLYLAPLMMAFPAVAAVLLGGASTSRATVFNAVAGVTLFQTLLTISLPVTQSVIGGDISEVAKLIISNGMILYALTRKEA